MKKRRRYERKKTRRKGVGVIDLHHLCWRRKLWSHGAFLELRRYPYCIISIPKNTLHKFIHENMTEIPLPREISAKEALEQLKLLLKFGGISEKDSIEKRLIVLVALFECTDPKTCDAFKRQLDIVREFNKKAPP